MIKTAGGISRLKKIIIMALVICALPFTANTRSSWAAPVGNPADPVLLEGKYPTKFDLQAETVIDRKLSSRDNGAVKYSADFLTAKFSYYIGRKMDIYGLIGTSQAKANGFIDKSFILTTKMDASWGLGASYIFHEFEFCNGIVRLGADAKYRQFETDTLTANSYRIEIPTSDKSFMIREWQGSLGASYQYKKIAPYCGLKYSDIRSDMHFTGANSVTYSDKTLSSKNKIGLFYGFDLLLTDSLALNMEMRNIDENALDMGFDFRF